MAYQPMRDSYANTYATLGQPTPTMRATSPRSSTYTTSPIIGNRFPGGRVSQSTNIRNLPSTNILGGNLAYGNQYAGNTIGVQPRASNLVSGYRTSTIG